MPYNFVADSFHTKKLCSRLSSRDFRRKMSVLLFKNPFVVLGVTYDNHLRFIRKRIGDFLLVLMELFLLGVTAEALRGIIVHQSFFFSEN